MTTSSIPDQRRPHRSIDWGDGATSAGVVAESGGNGSVTGGHAYAAAGTYTVTITVAVDDSGRTSGQQHQVVVFDGRTGFVTGGGWIDSPEGSYHPHESDGHEDDHDREGKVNYGFESKHHKDTPTPQEQPEFQVKGKHFEFQSTGYQSNSIDDNDSKATYRGSGKVGNTGGYEFLVTVNDDARKSGGGADHVAREGVERLDRRRGLRQLQGRGRRRNPPRRRSREVRSSSTDDGVIRT